MYYTNLVKCLRIGQNTNAILTCAKERHRKAICVAPLRIIPASVTAPGSSAGPRYLNLSLHESCREKLALRDGMTDNGLFNLSLNAPNLKPFEIGLCERSGIKEKTKCGLSHLYEYAIRSLTNSQYLTRLAQDRRRKKNQEMQTTVSKFFAYSHKKIFFA